ncbi:MAG: MFS transporter, partial [Bacteroidales bacterium]|nr:MFS transporter [Bacteroidales bacterium]
MKRQNWMLKTLNIRKEEVTSVSLMVLFSFFVGLSLSFYFTSSNAIFLKHFSPKMIPVSFIASGIIVYLAWYLFSYIDKKSTLFRQVSLKFLFVFITVLAISIGVWAFDSKWIAFIMYTWVRVMVYITLVNFWGIAGRLFNIRQGKRIFGLISVGEVISTIIGYFSIPLILKILKAPDLLFLSSFSLLLCLIFVFVIFKTFKEQLQPVKSPPILKQKEKKSEWGYWNLVKKPYFQMISLMALLPIFGYLFVDFLFLAQTKVEFSNNPETIARFLGIFLGSIAILELILKLFSGRFLNKYGLRPGLLSLPVVLLSSILLAAIFGTLYGPIGLFFSFISLARFFERSIRGAIYEPSFQLLYQPIPAEQRLPFQNQIEGIPKASGTVITGLVILIFSVIPGVTLVHYNWLFILILGYWIWISFKMYTEYRNMLKNKLSEMKSAELIEQDPMVALIRQTLSTADAGHLPKIIDFFEKVEPAGIKAVKEEIPSLSSPVKIKNEEEFTFDYMVDLARSDVAQERIMAARLLGTSGRYNTYKLLINLMKDSDPGVRKVAIISSGKIKRVELWPFIIENLDIPEYSHSAGEALKIIGEPVLQDLERFFEKISTQKSVKLKILSIVESIGGANAIKSLRKKVNHPDYDIRFQVLLSLSNLEYHASVAEITFIKQTIEESVETMVWIMASLNDLNEDIKSHTLCQALLQELEDKKENVFLLLSLLYDSKTIGHIREYIESQDANAKIYALEICDMTISEDIKELFFPIFEDLPIHEKLNRFRLRFPQQKMTFPERVEDIINKDYSRINRWTKACAIDLLSEIHPDGPERVTGLLAANIVNPDPLLAELSLWILYHNYPEDYITILVRFDKKGSQFLSRNLNKIKLREKNADLLIFEKIKLLKSSEFFAPVHELQLL